MTGEGTKSGKAGKSSSDNEVAKVSEVVGDEMIREGTMGSAEAIITDNEEAKVIGEEEEGTLCIATEDEADSEIRNIIVTDDLRSCGRLLLFADDIMCTLIRGDIRN